ncbi:hypothetical protein ANO11243_056650 [Dothideomycetidae sp. 11243]|nr:hypothetical protein ANO11243_056650 [fungal sp. No.11243]
MATSSMRPLAVWLVFLLCTIARALVVPSRDDRIVALLGNDSFPVVLPRQPNRLGRDDSCPPNPAGWDPEAPRCVEICSVSTCGRIGSSKRDLPFAQPLDIDILGNYSQTLNKRMQDSLTQGQINLYVAQNLHGGPYTQPYGPPLGREDSGPLSLITYGVGGTGTLLKQFNGQAAFQMGTAGFHGCTGITIVSKRAVFMAHTWEGPSWNQENPFAFVTGVINFFIGNSPLDGISARFDPSLFNAADDNTQIYIFHPRATGSNDYRAPQYGAKMTLLRNILQQLLPKSSMALYNYPRLQYSSQSRNNAQEAANWPDYQTSLTSARGGILFQYDPNGKGQGRPDWRLFMEEIQIAAMSQPLFFPMRYGIPEPPSN